MALSPRGKDSGTQSEDQEQPHSAARRDKASYFVMASTPMFDMTTGDYIPSQQASDEEISQPQAQPFNDPAYLPFVKSLLFKKDVQEQSQIVAALVRRELAAGQEVLISARWLAVSKNWSTVAVCQYCLDEITRLKDMLVNDSSVRLIQTASHINPNAMYLSQNAMVVQFNQGVSRAKEFLTMEDDCAVMIPMYYPEGGELSAWDRGFPAQRLALRFTRTNGFVMSGRTVLSLDSNKPVVCLIFSMAAMKKSSYPTYQVDPNPYDY